MWSWIPPCVFCLFRKQQKTVPNVCVIWNISSITALASNSRPAVIGEFTFWSIAFNASTVSILFTRSVNSLILHPLPVLFSLTAVYLHRQYKCHYYHGQWMMARKNLHGLCYYRLHSTLLSFSVKLAFNFICTSWICLHVVAQVK